MGLATISLTAGCTTQPYTSPQQQAQNACQAFGPKALSGALIGGLSGAAGGAGLGAIAGGGRGAAIGAGVGLLAGMFTGAAVGNQLDQRDCAQAQMALAELQAAPVGQPVAWHSPSGSYGTYTATGQQYASNDTFCRPTNQSLTLKGRQTTQQSGEVCRLPNGDYAFHPAAG
jgi:surface antigen